MIIPAIVQERGLVEIKRDDLLHLSLQSPGLYHEMKAMVITIHPAGKDATVFLAHRDHQSHTFGLYHLEIHGSLANFEQQTARIPRYFEAGAGTLKTRIGVVNHGQITEPHLAHTRNLFGF